jgi:glycine betaine/proline transport system substrate-binding protein
MRTKSYAFSIVGTALLGAALCWLPPAMAAAPESKDPIKIALFDWTSANVNAKILGGILERLGYKVEYPTADYLSVLTTGLTNGDVTVGLEFWYTTAGDAMKASDATHQTERLGTLGPHAIEEWWYPLYMKEKCLGLPDWHALQSPDCAKAFATPDTAPKGRYLAGPVTWGGYDEERVKALSVPFEVVHAGTDGAMFAELDSAYQRKAPIMLWIYSPHWATTKYQGEWIKFPAYTDECYDKKVYDCGKPVGEIWKYAWIGMKEKWPKAYEVAQRYVIGTDELNQMSGLVDVEGKSIDAVAAAWIDTHKAVWEAWTKNL